MRVRKFAALLAIGGSFGLSGLVAAQAQAAAALSIDTVAHDFGDVRTGEISTAVTVEISNIGDAPTTMARGAATTDDPAFRLVTNSCAPRTLNPGAECVMSVQFEPTTPGDATATLALANAVGPDLEVDLRGRGVGPVFAALPSSYDFGDVPAEWWSPVKRFRIVNSAPVGAGTPLTIDDVNLGGADPGEFRIVGDTCSAVTLDVGEECTVDARFEPGGVGAGSAELVFDDDAVGGPHAIPMAGTGVTSRLTMTPGDGQGFGVVRAGEVSSPIVFTLENVSANPVDIGTDAVAIDDEVDFELVSDTCSGATLAASGGSCTVSVRFAPTQAGGATVTLTVVDENGATLPRSIGARGTASRIVPSPSSADFGTVAVSTTSGVQSIFAVNSIGFSSGASAHFASPGATLVGADADEFAIAFDGCSGTVVAPSSSCRVDVTFTPDSPGAKSAALQFDSDDLGSPHVVPLTGTGM